MGLSTTYTKVETDFLLQKLESELVSGLRGELAISDTAPTAQGLYILSDIGTYTNLGGLVASADKLNYAYFDGTTWSKVEVEITTLLKDVEGGALSFDTAKMMLQGFMNQDTSVPINTVTIHSSALITGGHFLRKNNTYNNDGAYPNAQVIYNFPVGKATRLRTVGLFNLAPGAKFAPLTGQKKDGTTAFFIDYGDPTLPNEHCLMFQILILYQYSTGRLNLSQLWNY